MTKRRDRRENIAVDTDGRILAYTPEQVSRITAEIAATGEILAVIARRPGGDIAVQVFGPPSRDLLDVLEQATRGYRKALRAATQPF